MISILLYTLVLTPFIVLCIAIVSFMLALVIFRRSMAWHGEPLDYLAMYDE